MKKNRGKMILIIATVLLSLYFLYPTYQDYQHSKQLRALTDADSLRYLEDNEAKIREARLKRIKLGLDLQGGMRVVLEVDLIKLWEDMAKNKDDIFASIFAELRRTALTIERPLIDLLREQFEQRGVRLSRYYGNIRDSNEDILSRLEEESTNAVERAMQIVRNRVDQYGVSEPSIQKQGGRRIIVELPGVSKEDEVRQLLKGTALLEFKLLKDPDIAVKVMENIDKYLAGTALGDTLADEGKDTSLIPLPEDQIKAEEQAAKEHPFFYLARPNPQGTGEAYVAEEDRDKVKRILNRPEIRNLVPGDVQFLWSNKPAFVSEGKKYYTLFVVRRQAELTGGVIVNARATIDPNFNAPIVTMEMNPEGSRDWARITGANINKRIAIVLDSTVYSAPVVRSKIIGGNSQIEGMESVEEARLLEIVLKAGALPAPVQIIEQRTVGPSLGEDSIRKGLSSSLVAFGLTVLFMMLYYRTAGSIADIALLFNILFILAVLAGFQGTLTLPGIAGIILTIGMAVDANVLIYERIREEAGTGKTLRAAIDAGYEKAFSAIIDTNVTTFITGLILYQFGTGPVQGFALTLMIGIVASLFSAIVITRVIFDTMTERGVTRISFG